MAWSSIEDCSPENLTKTLRFHLYSSLSSRTTRKPGAIGVVQLAIVGSLLC
jgi:hypothetical protein